MKTLVSIAVAFVLLVLLTFSCKKESEQDAISSNLKRSEKLLQNSFQVVKFNDDLLKSRVSAVGQFTDPNVLTEDSLYHLNDSLCKLYYNAYCKAMKEGDNMMGGSLMNGNTTHGSGMMTTHTYTGDTAMINQYFRDLTIIRLSHSDHHPVATLSEHESHHQ
jgi:hypothetical protein